MLLLPTAAAIQTLILPEITHLLDTALVRQVSYALVLSKLDLVPRFLQVHHGPYLILLATYLQHSILAQQDFSLPRHVNMVQSYSSKQLTCSNRQMRFIGLICFSA